ncbi:hypothetical protein ABK905_15285 [Acerihabitans sp. KWT182]|uniref:Uncharacterized protein n=1 Tax=Acerihabitans sp. KWT182 TaxID=3157919 RepID=A0AAU7Q4V8_9GAMM
MAELIESLRQALQRADSDEHGYQSLKPGESLGSFIISSGDYKENLRLAAKNERPRISPSIPLARSTLSTRIGRAFKPWTKNTNLREYLAQQAEKIASSDSHSGEPARTALDFVKSLEKYAALSDRKSNGKRSMVMAIATYRMQKHTRDLLSNEFNRICDSLDQKKGDGTNYGR